MIPVMAFGRLHVPIMNSNSHSESESESEMYLFDPYKKCIQSNNETILDQGTPINTSLIGNIQHAEAPLTKRSIASPIKKIAVKSVHLGLYCSSNVLTFPRPRIVRLCINIATFNNRIIKLR